MNTATLRCTEQASLVDLSLIVDALRQSGGRYLDGHSNQLASGCAAVALHTVVLGDDRPDRVTVVMLHEGNAHSFPYYSVNDVRLREDGQVVLTRHANGVVREANGFTIEEHVQQYNRNHSPEHNPCYHARIEHLTRI